MTYRRDFTIGWKETRDFYLSLVLGHWWKGICGFGVVGVLAVLMYTAGRPLSLPARISAAAAGAVVAMALVTVFLVISTAGKVKAQIRRSGRETYVQETEINGFGVHVTVDKKKAKLAFENLVRVQETKKAFYLFLSDSQAWILPKGQMEDPDGESGQLRELFRTVVERGKLRLKG